MTDQGGFDDFEMLAGSSGGGTGGDPFGSGDGLGGDASSGVEFDASAFETPATAAVASPALSAGLGKFDGNEDAPTYDRDYDEAPLPNSNSNREEPEKIRKWREEQKIRLEEKDKDEEVQKGKLREQAKRELEEWYKAHEEQISKTKACNRAAEKEYQAMTAEVVPGQEWDRIAKLCEFNPKLSRASKDTSRMRSIILQLKQNPTGAKTPNSVAS